MEPIHPFLKRLQYGAGDIEKFIDAICGNRAHANHRNLKILKDGFFHPFFSRGQILRVDRLGRVAPIAVPIYGVHIDIYSVYCALAAFIMLANLRPPECSERPFKYSLWILVLLAKWSDRIATERDLSAPDTYSTIYADENQPRRQRLPTPPSCILVCGTTKPRQRGDPNFVLWTEARQRKLGDAIGAHPQAKLANITRFAEKDKFYFNRAPLVQDVERIKTQIRQAFSRDPALVKMLTAIMDKFRDTPGVTDKNRPRHTFGSCAETWGIQVLGTTLAVGALGTSFSISGMQSEALEAALMCDDWEDKIELKPACNNCVYLYGVVALNCGVTIRDCTRL